jgi:hypothetical protein
MTTTAEIIPRTTTWCICAGPGLKPKPKSNKRSTCSKQRERLKAGFVDHHYGFGMDRRAILRGYWS